MELPKAKRTKINLGKWHRYTLLRELCKKREKKNAVSTEIQTNSPDVLFYLTFTRLALSSSDNEIRNTVVPATKDLPFCGHRVVSRGGRAI